MMANPLVQSLLQSPDFIRSTMQSNPQVRAMMEANPEMAAALNDPSTLAEIGRVMANPVSRRARGQGRGGSRGGEP